jgi:hypothetical protein
MTIVANLAEDFVFASKWSYFQQFAQKLGTLLQRILTCLYLQPRWSLHLPANFASSQKGLESQHKVHHHGKVKKTTPNSKLPTLCLTANKQTSKQASTFSSTDKTQVPWARMHNNANKVVSVVNLVSGLLPLLLLGSLIPHLLTRCLLLHLHFPDKQPQRAT